MENTLQFLNQIGAQGHTSPDLIKAQGEAQAILSGLSAMNSIEQSGAAKLASGDERVLVTLSLFDKSFSFALPFQNNQYYNEGVPKLLIAPFTFAQRVLPSHVRLGHTHPAGEGRVTTLDLLTMENNGWSQSFVVTPHSPEAPSAIVYAGTIGDPKNGDRVIMKKVGEEISFWVTTLKLFAKNEAENLLKLVKDGPDPNKFARVDLEKGKLLDELLKLLVTEETLRHDPSIRGAIASNPIIVHYLASLNNMAGQPGLAQEIVSGGLWQILLMNYGIKPNGDLNNLLSKVRIEIAQKKSAIAAKFEDESKDRSFGLALAKGNTERQKHILKLLEHNKKDLSSVVKAMAVGLLHAPVYNSGVDFAGLLDEASGIKGDALVVRGMSVEVLDAEDFKNTGGIKGSGAFYKAGIMYLELSTLQKAVHDGTLASTILRLVLHEAAHAYLQGIVSNPVQEEMMVLSVLGRVLNFVSTEQEKNMALQQVALESIEDVLKTLKNPKVLREAPLENALTRFDRAAEVSILKGPGRVFVVQAPYLATFLESPAVAERLANDRGSLQIFVVTHENEKDVDLVALQILEQEDKIRGILKVPAKNGKYDVGKLMVELKTYSANLAQGPITLVGNDTLWTNLEALVKVLQLDILHVVKHKENEIQEAKLYTMQQ